MREALRIKPGETFQAKIDWSMLAKCSVCGQPADSGIVIIRYSQIETYDDGEQGHPVDMFCKACYAIEKSKEKNRVSTHQ